MKILLEVNKILGGQAFSGVTLEKIPHYTWFHFFCDHIFRTVQMSVFNLSVFRVKHHVILADLVLDMEDCDSQILGLVFG